MAISIRLATAGDSDRIFELLVQFAVSAVPARAAFDGNYPCIVAAQNPGLKVAEVDGYLVGYSLANLMGTLYANGPIILLAELMVDPDYRSRGVGMLLMETVIADAKLAGAKEVVLATSRAKGYYPRFGFKETAGYFKLKL